MKKRIILGIIAFMLISTSSFARLGETREEINARYKDLGTVEWDDNNRDQTFYFPSPSSMDASMDAMDKITWPCKRGTIRGFMTFLFFDAPLPDTCQCLITYNTASDSIRNILERNAQGAKWEVPVSPRRLPFWLRSDGGYAVHNRWNCNEVLILSSDLATFLRQKLKEKKNEEEKKKNFNNY